MFLDNIDTRLMFGKILMALRLMHTRKFHGLLENNLMNREDRPFFFGKIMLKIKIGT